MLLLATKAVILIIFDYSDVFFPLSYLTKAENTNKEQYSM